MNFRQHTNIKYLVFQGNQMTISFRSLVENSNIDTQIVVKNNDVACNDVYDNEWQIEHTTDGCSATTLAFGKGSKNNGTIIKFTPAKAASSEYSVLATQLPGTEVSKDSECPLDSGEFAGISNPWYRIK
jgi:hypothetical protein